MIELFRALAVLAEPQTSKTSGLATALGLGPLPNANEYTELFTFQLYPYASVYLGAEGMLGGEARDRVAGFWRALGQTPPAEPDHLSVMLATYARLIALEEGERDAMQRTSWRSARKAFLWEHLLSWLPAYLGKLLDIAPPFYCNWGELLTKSLLEEAETVGKQEELSRHLSEASGIVDPRDGKVGEFLQSLLTPVRSGMILTRADLTAAARKLRLGRRLGERKFILESLFSQDAAGTLGWLTEEVSTWTRRHRLYREALGKIAIAWEKRAAAAAALLRKLEVAASTV
ncbi:MAG: TorD/DmsD family molecular chaperone [Pyrinomonadaceae bacterium]